jgi:Do/DeqQ family serine protease
VQSAFRYVSATVLPSVVEVNVVETTKAPVQGDGQNPWRFFFGQPDNGSGDQPPQDFKQEGLGSGIIIKRDGKTVYVLTNNHVAGDANEISVLMYDGREFKASLVGTDKRKDIAVIKFETTDKDIQVATLGDSASLAIGDWAIAVGNPLGFASSVTIGVVSALGRTGGPEDSISDFIQTDAAINKGNSGGALVNIKGEVVGMNTWIASPTGASIGLGFAIPINTAKKTIDDLIGKGKVEYGWLGIQMSGIDKASAAELGVDAKKGAFVSQVFSGSPAAKAGIQAGDYIVGANGQDIKSTDQVVRLVSDIPAGRSASFSLMRDGKTFDVKVVIEVRKDTIATNDGNLYPGLAVLSLKSEDIDISKLNLPKGTEGVLVVNVFAKSPAAIIGVKPGDVITAVNDAKVASVGDFYRLLNDPKGGKFAFTLIREGQTVTTLASARK